MFDLPSFSFSIRNRCVSSLPTVDDSLLIVPFSFYDQSVVVLCL